MTYDNNNNNNNNNNKKQGLILSLENLVLVKREDECQTEPPTL